MKIEKHDAVVTGIDADEAQPRGRIKVACAGLVGDEETELPMWVEPAFDWGWFFVPDIGEMVEIEAVVESDGDESYGQSSIENIDIHWRGKRRYTDEETEEKTEARPLHEDFQTNYGKRRGFATPNGHILYFDDTSGKEKIHLSWKQGEDGDAKYQYLSMTDDGSAILSNAAGSMIFMNAKDKEVTIIDENSNMIGTSDKGIQVTDKFSNTITLGDGVVQVLSQKAITIMGGVIDLKASTINLQDGADSPVVRGTELKAYLESHVHPTGMGPSGPPAVPLPPNALSQNTKVGI